MKDQAKIPCPYISVERLSDTRADIWFLPAECNLEPQQIEEIADELCEQNYGSMIVAAHWPYGYITVRADPKRVAKRNVDQAIVWIETAIANAYVFGDSTSEEISD